MRSTGIRNFFRNVSLGNLRSKANCILDLGRFVGKKLLAGGPSFRLVKECFLEDLRPFATSISDLSFSVM